MKTLNICIITTDFDPTKGGIASLTESLSFHLALSPDVKFVNVLAMKNQNNNEEYINSKLHVTRQSGTSLLSICINTWKLMFRHRKSDIFHATTAFPIGFIVLIFGKYILGKPVFISYYGTDLLTNKGRGITKWAKRWAVVHSTKSIALGKNIRRLVEEKMNLGPMTSEVIGYALPDNVKAASESEINTINQEFNIREDDFVVLFVGNLIKRKGCHELLDAVATIRDDRVKLIFVGTGPERQFLESKAELLKCSNSIYFAGRRKNLEPFYKIAGVFCMPSYFDKISGDIEGLGIVFLEAAQHKVPSIGTISGGIPDAINDKVTGFLIQERDVNAIQEKILYMKNNKGARQTMGENAQKFVKEKFNNHKVVTSHLNLYRNFIRQA